MGSLDTLFFYQYKQGLNLHFKPLFACGGGHTAGQQDELLELKIQDRLSQELPCLESSGISELPTLRGISCAGNRSGKSPWERLGL